MKFVIFIYKNIGYSCKIVKWVLWYLYEVYFGVVMYILLIKKNNVFELRYVFRYLFIDRVIRLFWFGVYV